MRYAIPCVSLFLVLGMSVSAQESNAVPTRDEVVALLDGYSDRIDSYEIEYHVSATWPFRLVKLRNPYFSIDVWAPREEITSDEYSILYRDDGARQYLKQSYIESDTFRKIVESSYDGTERRDLSYTNLGFPEPLILLNREDLRMPSRSFVPEKAFLTPWKPYESYGQMLAAADSEHVYIVQEAHNGGPMIAVRFRHPHFVANQIIEFELLIDPARDGLIVDNTTYVRGKKQSQWTVRSTRTVNGVTVPRRLYYEQYFSGHYSHVSQHPYMNGVRVAQVGIDIASFTPNPPFTDEAFLIAIPENATVHRVGFDIIDDEPIWSAADGLRIVVSALLAAVLVIFVTRRSRRQRDQSTAQV